MRYLALMSLLACQLAACAPVAQPVPPRPSPTARPSTPPSTSPTSSPTAPPGTAPTPVPGSSSTPSPASGQIMVSTLAGTGSFGFADGSPGQFYHPSSVVVAPDGSALVNDRFNHRIRRVSPAGVVSTVWGDGEQGSDDGGDGVGSINQAIALVRLANGDLLIADAQNHAIRRLSPSGEISTFVGMIGNDGYRDGKGTAAQFSWPSDLIEDSDGTIYVSDRFNHAIRKITPDGTVSTLAGSGSQGASNGQGSAASFNEPMGLTMGPDRHLYVSDGKNSLIRKVSLSGVVTTFAGSGQMGSRDDSLLKAEFRETAGLTFAPDGTLYVIDRFNHGVRRIRDGRVTTLAGTGQPALVNGPAETAAFAYPFDVAVTAAGDLLVADYVNHAIRKIDLP